MTDDLISARLAAIRERRELAANTGLGFQRSAERHDALVKLGYEDVPRLLAAVEDVLKRHHPEDRGRVLPCCAFCCTEDECVAWLDCPEREAIERELTRGAPETGVPATTTTGD